ncbi:hypothetical protein AB0F46_06590 [Streptomyces sp. NPDC026665]|uniref:hypothetical protein n=1 Tax=Streptomyces sp. NPDC026665 TaxID=3154798 RepID=UPI0034112B9B
MIFRTTSSNSSPTWTFTGRSAAQVVARTAAAARHTVKLVVVGTGGRPAVTTDGLVYLK